MHIVWPVDDSHGGDGRVVLGTGTHHPFSKRSASSESSQPVENLRVGAVGELVVRFFQEQVVQLLRHEVKNFIHSFAFSFGLELSQLVGPSTGHVEIANFSSLRTVPSNTEAYLPVLGVDNNVNCVG
jgi:hypothetical protein